MTERWNSTPAINNNLTFFALSFCPPWRKLEDTALYLKLSDKGNLEKKWASSVVAALSVCGFCDAEHDYT